MAENENVWTQDIESEELGALLDAAAATGHPEHAYHVRHGLASGKMSEAEAIKYLKDPPKANADQDDGDGDEDDDEDEPQAPAKAAPAKAPTKR